MDHSSNTADTSLTLPGKQQYGRYALLLLSFPFVYGLIKPSSIPVFLSEIIMMVLTIAVLASGYFLILWVLEIIRFRGGIERPQNYSARTYGNYALIIFLIMAPITQIPFDFQLEYPVLLPILVILKIVLPFALYFFMTLCVLEIIRLRGGIQRPINVKARRIFAFIAIFLTVLAIVGQWMFASLFGFTL